MKDRRNKSINRGYVLIDGACALNIDVVFRSSRQRCSMKKKVISRNFIKFTEKHLCQSLFINKVADLSPGILLKKRLWNRCFPMNFAKFLRTLFLWNTSGGCFCFFDFITSIIPSSIFFTTSTGIIYFLNNPFHATSLFIYPLKTSENKRYIFRGYRKRSVHEMD